MTKLFYLLLTLFLTGCSVTIKETYVLKKYPVEWEEEIVTPTEHFHYEDYITCEWKCCYIESDTICWHQKDTIEVLKLVKVEKIKKFGK
jgi:hypothetical protein